MSVKIQAGDFLKSDICKENEKQLNSLVNSKFNNKKRKLNQNPPQNSLGRPTANSFSTISSTGSLTTQLVENNYSTNNFSNNYSKNNLINSNSNQPSHLIMSDDAESMFIIGSIVVVETGWGNSFEGEVIAFDYKYKILLLKSSSKGSTTGNDIHLINLECAKNVKIKKEAKQKEHANFPSIEIDKVEKRKNTAIDERKRLVRAFDAGINEDGLKLYLHISKQLKVTFEGKNIIVMKDVLIAHPYKADNCSLIQGLNQSNEKKNKNQAVDYVKGIVEKFWSENLALNNNTNNN